MATAPVAHPARVCAARRAASVAATFLAVGLGWPILVYTRDRRRVARAYDAAGCPRDDGIRLDPGMVRTLRVLPLVDWYAARDDLATEAGVAYLVQAGDTTILFDLGLNGRRETEPPLLRNLARLGLSPATIDGVVISHPHPDHLGGVGNFARRRAIVRRSDDPLAGKPVYATAPLAVTGGVGRLVDHPMLLAPGVATTGPLPAAVPLLGYTPEQALVIRVEGCGLVLIIGCGHPGVAAFVERAEQIFQIPVYGVIGGFHLPVTGDRAGRGPFTPQRWLAGYTPPWHPPDRATVDRTIAYLRGKGVRLVAPSAHDSCDWSLGRFAAAFGDRYRALRVGQWLAVPSPANAGLA